MSSNLIQNIPLQPKQLFYGEQSMKIQISFDESNLQQAIEIGKKVAPFADIFEVGTSLIYQYGIEAIKRFSEEFPNKIILADSKIVDRGTQATEIFAKSGAHWITVMAGSGSAVIHTTCAAAHNKKLKVMLDLMDANSPGQMAMDAEQLGVDALIFHRPFDEQSKQVLLDEWDMIQGNTKLPIFISAKINRQNIAIIQNLKPTGYVIGESITKSANPEVEAEYFYNLIGNK